MTERICSACGYPKSSLQHFLTHYSRRLQPSKPDYLSECSHHQPGPTDLEVAHCPEIIVRVCRVCQTELYWSVDHWELVSKSAFYTMPDHKKQLQFSYTNWRGEDHTYLVYPEKVEYGAYAIDDSGDPEDKHWFLHAWVVERDGERRPGRRTFLLSGLRNTEEVDAT